VQLNQKGRSFYIDSAQKIPGIDKAIRRDHQRANMDEISVNSPKEVLSQCTDAPQGKIPTMKYDNRIEVLKKLIKIPFFRAGSISISDKNIAG
jgi:hypothetical protein